MKQATRLLLIVVVAAVLTACSGCIRMEMGVAVAPDGSTTGRIVGGIDASLAQSGTDTKSPFSDITKSGGNWTSREYRDGNWAMTEAVGSAAPGQPLFPKGDKEAPQTKLVSSAHRLSTQYTLTLLVPTPDKEVTKPSAEAADEQMQAMMKSMLATFQISFSLKSPGRVIATTGKVVGPGKAEWKLNFDDLTNKAMPDFRLTTELPNWANIGKLADQLAYTGTLYDAAPKLAAAVERGLLPNPLVSTKQADKLKPEDYARLLEIIDKLDASGRPAVTNTLIAKLGLNDDDTSASAIAKAHARVMKLDVRGLSDKAITGALGDELK